MFKRHLLLITFLLLGIVAKAQQDNFDFNKENFLAESNFVSGKLLVKLKPEYRDILLLPHERTPNVARTFEELALEATQMYHEKFIRRRVISRVKKSSGIDVSLFYHVAFNASIPVKIAIDELKALGVFEYVEPDLVYTSAFQPSDRLLSEQYYLESVKAFEAWDITKGSQDIIIGVVDSGSDFNHPDLKNKFYKNPLEIPDNDIDDDQNGYIDDVRGWDFAGADTLRATQDNNAQIVENGKLHGTWVAGVAAAETDNDVGIAGIGYNSKFLSSKHSYDNQRQDDGRVFSTLSGIIFLTESNVDVMNLSFGSFFRSDITAEAIRVATEDEDIVVVASAGNSNSTRPRYPASYPNVISVAAIDEDDIRADFTSSGNTVDLSAPGVDILTTTEFQFNYETVNGTSFSAPIVAGAAALLRAHFPDFSARQIAQQLRVSANPSIYELNENRIGTLGKGKLDILAALTDNKPGIIYENISITNTQGNENIQPGDTIMITGDFTNLLFASSPQLQAKITPENRRSSITELRNAINLGEISEGQAFNNKSSPFLFKISESATSEFRLFLRLDITDTDYDDSQVFTIDINPSIIDIERNLLATSIPNNGRVGFKEYDSDKGLGLVFQEENLLFEMGLMMGTSASDISSSVRTDEIDGNETVDDHFKTLSPILSTSPGERSLFEVFGKLDNSLANTQSKVEIDYRSLVFAEDPNDQYVILEYEIKNTDTTDINDYFVGLFTDWDIGRRDSADWNSDYRLGYVFNPEASNSVFAGIQELTGRPNYFPINNNPSAPNNPFGIYDGFSDIEKFRCLSSGDTVLTHVNMPESAANDLSHTVSSGPFNIPVGESIKVAFAIHAGESLEDILGSAEAADKMYNDVFNLTKPTLSFTPNCFGEAIDVTASGSGDFRWYAKQFGGEAFFEGSIYATTPLLEDTILYVSSVDNGIESLREKITVSTSANPQITINGNTQLCQGDTTILTARLADAYLWSNGETTRSIAVTASGEYTLKVTDNTLGCTNTSEPINITVYTPPTAAFDISLGSNNLRTNTQIQLTDLSTNAIAWEWDFGDGTTSQEQNPTIAFDEIGEFTITLTVTSVSGCTNSISQTFQVTSLGDEFLLEGITVFPNPHSGTFTFSLENEELGNVTLQLTSVSGKEVRNESLIKSHTKLQHSINMHDLPTGFYLLKVILEDKFTVKRVIKKE